MRFPYAFLGGLGGKQDNPLAFVHDKPFDQHEPDEGLAETDAVTEERAAVLAGDLHQRPVGFLLIAVNFREHQGAGFIPLVGSQFVTAEILLQGLGIDVERGVVIGLAGQGHDDVIGHLAGFVPVRLEPFLQLSNLAPALDLDVEFDVLGKARRGEIA